MHHFCCYSSSDNIVTATVTSLQRSRSCRRYRHPSSLPCWKINSFLPEVSVCWRCTDKRTVKIESTFSVTLPASPATRRSFQQSPQLPAVAPAFNSRCNLQQLLELPHSFPRRRFQVPNSEVVSKSPEVVSSDCM